MIIKKASTTIGICITPLSGGCWCQNGFKLLYSERASFFKKKTFLLLDIKQTNEAYGYKEHGTSTEVVKFITPGSLVWFWYKGQIKSSLLRCIQRAIQIKCKLTSKGNKNAFFFFLRFFKSMTLDQVCSFIFVKKEWWGGGGLDLLYVQLSSVIFSI